VTDVLISIMVGAGLAAACGFRVFVPFLALSIAARMGHMPLSPDFAWIATTPALVAFVTATALEVGAYYIPWIDNALDAIATPTAVLAGVVIMAAVVVELPPVLRWGIAIIAGAGMAGAVQSASVVTRLKSSVATAGIANPAVATAETFGASALSVLSIVLPLVAVLLVLGLAVGIFTGWRRLTARRRARNPGG
jgi:hypothetical protein